MLLVLAYAAASSLAAAPDDPGVPDESGGVPAGLVDSVEPPVSVDSVTAGTMPADVLETGIEDREITGLSPEMAAGAIADHFRIEYGREFPAQVGLDPVTLAQALELHARAEGKR